MTEFHIPEKVIINKLKVTSLNNDHEEIASIKHTFLN